LEGRCARSRAGGPFRFQYLKGAIGRIATRSGRNGYSAFQYLKGAIGRSAPRLHLIGKLTFQYLKGAIGRPPPMRLRRSECLHFNTSKVRLEVEFDLLGSTNAANFNTSKVRLEEAALADYKLDRQRISIPQRCDWKPRSSQLQSAAEQR